MTVTHKVQDKEHNDFYIFTTVIKLQQNTPILNPWIVTMLTNPNNKMSNTETMHSLTASIEYLKVSGSFSINLHFVPVLHKHMLRLLNKSFIQYFVMLSTLHSTVVQDTVSHYSLDQHLKTPSNHFHQGGGHSFSPLQLIGEV